METNLFELREFNGLYQKDIAKAVGVNQRTYSLWERGLKIIPLKHLNTLCNYYDVNMDYVLKLQDKPKSSINKPKSIDKKAVGSRIKYIRTKKNITNRDLARNLNTTSSTVSAYEAGKTLILTAFAYQISKKYNVSVDWLCGRE